MRHHPKEMKSKRRKHSSGFKARIALEALKGLKTVQEIVAENELHPVQVTKWKSQMLEGATGVLDNGKSAEVERKGREVEKAPLGTQGWPTRRGGRLAAKKVQGVGDRSMRKAMIEKEGSPLSVRRQCILLGVNRNRLEPGTGNGVQKTFFWPVGWTSLRWSFRSMAVGAMC